MDMIDDDRQKAQELQAWLTTLNLPPRVANPLRRALEVVLGEREGVPGKDVRIAGMDRAMFVAELYRPEGGAIRELPAVGALVIEALREVIPPPRPAVRMSPAAPPLPDEGWREFELDEALAPHAQPEAPPPLRVPDLPAITVHADTLPAPANDLPTPPRRRGRPRKQVNTTPGLTQQRRFLVSIAAPVALPSATTPAAQAPAPQEPAIATEPDESQLRQLWRELHPQGRRAVLGYISELLIR
jgi:hypothetical protein